MLYPNTDKVLTKRYMAFLNILAAKLPIARGLAQFSSMISNPACSIFLWLQVALKMFFQDESKNFLEIIWKTLSNAIFRYDNWVLQEIKTFSLKCG